MPQLTSKDLQVLNALILLEYSGNKKAAVHAGCFTDKNLKKLAQTFAAKYKTHFEALQKTLEGYK